jgi:hypothetical protein
MKITNAREIDRLGRLLAKIADLTAQADEIKDVLKSSELTEFEGKLFRATVSTSERVSLDSKKVRIALGDLASLCEKTSTVTVVRVVSK